MREQPVGPEVEHADDRERAEAGGVARELRARDERGDQHEHERARARDHDHPRHLGGGRGAVDADEERPEAQRRHQREPDRGAAGRRGARRRGPPPGSHSREARITPASAAAIPAICSAPGRSPSASPTSTGTAAPGRRDRRHHAHRADREPAVERGEGDHARRAAQRRPADRGGGGALVGERERDRQEQQPARRPARPAAPPASRACGSGGRRRSRRAPSTARIRARARPGASSACASRACRGRRAA